MLKEKSNEQKSEMVFSFWGKNSFHLQVTAEVVGAYTRKLFRKTRTWIMGRFISALKPSNIQIPQREGVGGASDPSQMDLLILPVLVWGSPWISAGNIHSVSSWGRVTTSPILGLRSPERRSGRHYGVLFLFKWLVRSEGRGVNPATWSHGLWSPATPCC